MGTVLIKKERDKYYTFEIKSLNGRVIMRSAHPYQAKASITNAINSVYKNCMLEDRYEIVENYRTGDKVVQLKSTNGQVIAKSDVYYSRTGAVNCICSMMKNMIDSELIDTTK